MQKTVTFLEFDIKIENISVNQSPSQFLSQLYTCYQSCNSIYYQPEKNKNVYLEIFAPIKDKIEGKILKGRYPYRPDIIDASTHQKKNNPKGINDIEPQIGYFIFKIENINSTSIDGRALIQIRYSSYFKELFLKLLG